MARKKTLLVGLVKAAVLAVTAGLVIASYGCNTVRGVGQDLEKAGESIQRAGNR